MAKARAIYNVRVDVAGGFIALGLDVNLTELDDHDREFVSGLLMAMLDRAREVALKRAKQIEVAVLDGTKAQAEEVFEAAYIDGPGPISGEGRSDG